MIYPANVQIETTTACNARCRFCPHSAMNVSGRMSDALVTKLVDEMASWDRHLQVCPFLTNEPFADPRIFDICVEINRKVPKACLTFFSNVSLLDAAKAEKLVALRNVESLHCSLHHSNAEAYKAEMGLPFDRTVNNIKRLLEMKPSFRVFVLRVSDGNDDENATFIRFCEQSFPGAAPYVAVRWNWKGDIPSTYEPYIGKPCPRHSSICITASGKVALCCMDQNADYSIGDVSRETILDAYNGVRRAYYVNSPRREVVPCNKCNMR